LPVIRKMILSYYKTLLDAGLAVKISLHTMKGEYFGDAMATSPEVVEAMLRQVLESGLPSDREVGALNKIALIWRLRKGDYRVGESGFLDLLASHGIVTDELREELNALNKRRATSKYANRAGEKSFIVVDEGRFREYVLDKLKKVEAAVMGAET